MKIAIKRAYEKPSKADGRRVLVDRVWPRGKSRKALAIETWEKDLAPSGELRRWYCHDVKLWSAFKRRYRKELSAPEQRKRLRSVLSAAGKGPLTLVYGAKDEEHNQAIVLREVLARMRR